MGGWSVARASVGPAFCAALAGGLDSAAAQETPGGRDRLLAAAREIVEAARHCPVVSEACGIIGDPQTRCPPTVAFEEAK